MKTICCVFNYAPHYRTAVYKLMEEELACDFYFGNKVKATIRKIDYSIFDRPVKELKSFWFFNRIYWIAGSVSLLFRPYKKYLLTGETLCLSNWVMMLFSKLMRKQVYVWSHGWYGNETGLQRAVKKLYFSLVNAVFLYGDHARKLMICEGFNPQKLHVIYNSLDYEKTITARNQQQRTSVYYEHFLNNNPVIIFIGRLTAGKKLDMLITTLCRLNENDNQINLVIVGDGEEKSHLLQLVEQYNLKDQAWFYGQTYDEEVIGELIYNADLCVSPGNVGLTAIHALSYGTPVITHDNFAAQMPEFEAIESGSNGDFFTEGNIESLQSTISNWLLVHRKKERKLIAACYKRIDDFFNPAYQVLALKKGMNLDQ